MRKKIIQVTCDYMAMASGDHYRSFTVGKEVSEGSSPAFGVVVDEIVPFYRDEKKIIQSVLVKVGDFEIEVGRLHTKTWGPLNFGIEEEDDGKD